MTRLLVLAAAVALWGCGGPVRPLRPFTGLERVDCPATDARDALEATYLGAGGFLLRWHGQAIMTAPFYSNPGLVRVGLGLPIRPDRRRIDALLPRVDDVEAMLVGHAHYDHLMDAVYVAQRHATRAKVYGSDTVVNLLAAVAIPGGVESVEGRAGDATSPGEWVPIGGGIRFMALRSEHAPHFCGLTLFGGRVGERQDRLPCTAYGWKEGQTLAYLIEFLRADGSVALRLHYQDAASTPPLGFPPPASVGGPARADVAILCVAGFDKVPHYPEAVLRRLGARTIVLGHWENFFRNPEKPLQMVPSTDAAKFVRALDPVATDLGARWLAPRPGATLRLCDRP